MNDTEEHLRRRRARLERLAAGYKVGDVVYERSTGHVGIITREGRLAPKVVWANGGGRTGPMLGLRHYRPRINMPVPSGALDYRHWNREQAVTAALRKVGIVVSQETTS